MIELRAEYVTVKAIAKTLEGAKREATKWMTYGGGDVYIVVDGEDVCVRRFWQEGQNFGWEQWETL